MKKLYILFFTILTAFFSFGQDLVITSVFDAPLPGGFPKGIEIYVINDIADISIYGLEIAGNGGASSGTADYNFPADAYTAGDFIYVGRTDDTNGNISADAFLQYYGVTLTYETNEVSHNGDDVILLYNGASVVDTWGELGVHGDGTAWESTDGWAYRVDGQGPNATFTIAEWTFSGVDATDGCDLMDDSGTNAMCASVNPIGSYSPIPSMATTIAINSPADFAVLAIGTTSVNIEFTAANLGMGDQVDITVTKNAGTPVISTNVGASPFTIMGTADGDAFEVTAEIVNGMTQIDFETIDFSIDLILATDLVINEFLADPAAGVPDGDANGDGVRESSDDEFIEIYNSGVSSIDMEGYTISDASGLIRHTFTGTILPAGGFVTVFGGGAPAMSIGGIVQIANEGGTPALGLNNGGDVITLRDGGGTKRLVETYGGEGGNNQSLARNPDITGPFVEHTSIVANAVNFSPGEDNDGTLSADDFSLNNFKVYPNPTSLGYVNIVSQNNETVKAIVFDILGKQVINSAVTNNKLNVSNLNTGVYIMRLTQNNTTITKKLVIN